MPGRPRKEKYGERFRLRIDTLDLLLSNDFLIRPNDFCGISTSLARKTKTRPKSFKDSSHDFQPHYTPC